VTNIEVCSGLGLPFKTRQDLSLSSHDRTLVFETSEQD
jgi:hypothetical protein